MVGQLAHRASGVDRDVSSYASLSSDGPPGLCEPSDPSSSKYEQPDFEEESDEEVPWADQLFFCDRATRIVFRQADTADNIGFSEPPFCLRR